MSESTPLPHLSAPPVRREQSGVPASESSTGSQLWAYRAGQQEPRVLWEQDESQQPLPQGGLETLFEDEEFSVFGGIYCRVEKCVNVLQKPNKRCFCLKLTSQAKAGPLKFLLFA